MKRLIIAALALGLLAPATARAAPFRDCPGSISGWKAEADRQTTTCGLARSSLRYFLREYGDGGGVPDPIAGRSPKTGRVYSLSLVRLTTRFTYYGWAGRALLRVRLHSTLY